MLQYGLLAGQAAKVYKLVTERSPGWEEKLETWKTAPDNTPNEGAHKGLTNRMARAHNWLREQLGLGEHTDTAPDKNWRLKHPCDVLHAYVGFIKQHKSRGQDIYTLFPNVQLQRHCLFVRLSNLLPGSRYCTTLTGLRACQVTSILSGRCYNSYVQYLRTLATYLCTSVPSLGVS